MTVHMFNDGGGMVTRTDDVRAARAAIVREYLYEREGIDLDNPDDGQDPLDPDGQDWYRTVIASASRMFAAHRATVETGRLVGRFDGDEYEGWEWRLYRPGKPGVTRAVVWNP